MHFVQTDKQKNNNTLCLTQSKNFHFSHIFSWWNLALELDHVDGRLLQSKTVSAPSWGPPDAQSCSVNQTQGAARLLYVTILKVDKPGITHSKSTGRGCNIYVVTQQQNVTFHQIDLAAPIKTLHFLCLPFVVFHWRCKTRVRRALAGVGHSICSIQRDNH